MEKAELCGKIGILKQDEQEQRVQTFFTTASHYHHIARIPDLESQHDAPDHPQNLINCSLYYCRAILKMS